MGKRVALKYCGGCDPGYDRVEYFRKIQKAAGDRIDWVGLEEGGFRAVLVISGCETACPEEDLAAAGVPGIISVRDDGRDPSEIVQSLLSEETS